jgi:esterase
MRLATTRTGTGPRPVILLHGFLGSGRNLSMVARGWSQADPSRSFLLPDLTGHGSSPALPPNAGLDVLARDILDTAAAEGLTQPLTLVGHSMGGRVALQAKLLAPEAIAHVTLLDIAPGPIGDAGAEQDRTMREFVALPPTFSDRDAARRELIDRGLDKPQVEWLLTNLIPDGEAYRWRMDRTALQLFRPRINAADLWPAVERFGHTMQCIRGDRSPYVTEADRERLERLGCPVRTLTEAGHFIHVDRPRTLVEWLAADTP